MYVPSDSFGGLSPEKKASQALETLLTFTAAKIVLAQLEGSGRGALAAYNQQQYAVLSSHLQEVSLRDPEAWLADLLRKNKGIALRLMEVRAAYASTDFEWDQLQRLTIKDVKEGNLALMRKAAAASLQATQTQTEPTAAPTSTATAAAAAAAAAAPTSTAAAAAAAPEALVARSKPQTTSVVQEQRPQEQQQQQDDTRAALSAASHAAAGGQEQQQQQQQQPKGSSPAGSPPPQGSAASSRVDAPTPAADEAAEAGPPQPAVFLSVPTTPAAHRQC